MRPIISYYGGKQKLSKHLLPLIPEHQIYVEPFAGGLALLFAKQPGEKEVINDIKGDLINLYRMAQTRGEELLNLLKLTPFSEAEYAKAKLIVKEGHDDALWRAWATYVNMQMAFGNIPHGGWSRSRHPGSNDANQFANGVDALRAKFDRFRDVYICQTDAIKCIEQWDSENAFIYCDPPYPGADQGDYSGYTAADFQNLIDALDKCAGSFMLSCYLVPEAKIPAHWETYSFSTTCTINKAQKEVERTEIAYRHLNDKASGSQQLRLFA